MAALDRVKEEGSYLRFWQGIAVVTNISLIGWLITSERAIGAPFVLGVVGVSLLTVSVIIMHRRNDD